MSFRLFFFFVLIYNLYVELFYKKRYLYGCVLFFLDMTQNEKNNSGDEIDFYDFLEVVADKVDSITQQSMKKNK